MKRNFFNLNRGWYVVLSILCVFVIGATFFVACNHNESEPTPADDGIEYPIPENAEVIVSFVFVIHTSENKEMLTDNGDLAVAISESARPFYLPKDIRHYQKYFDLITAKRTPNILKLTIGQPTDQGSPILKVEVPDEESEEYLKMKERWDNREVEETLATSENEGIEYPIPENAEVTIDQAGIIRNDNEDLVIGIGVRPSAYYLPKDIKGYQQYYRLLETTGGSVNILKLTIGYATDKGKPIVKVELPNGEEIRLWHELHTEDNLTEDIQRVFES
ncbi:MAG: hypothetical protein LBU27_03440 [Candidatus Peribacteria bacterium]|nr:hypothetical protein [Candidatus Peribacteria bacterium]